MRTSPLKWVGSKQKILNNLLPHLGVPNTFVDVFAGSSTVSLNVDAAAYIINDANPDLIWFFKHTINNPSAIISEAKNLFSNVDSSVYASNRDRFNSLAQGDIYRSILFLFLNKFGFNGLCRYNSKGQFNVPYSKKSSYTVPEKQIHEFVSFFKNKNVVFLNVDFTDKILYNNLKENDVVYFDPPYLSAEEFTTTFTGYTKLPFTYDQHKTLKNIAVDNKKSGIKTVISNSCTATTKELYSDANEIVIIPKRRMVASDKNKRIVVDEILAIYK